MDLVVVDTDVLSFIFKHDSRGEAYKPHLAGKEITADAWVAATALLHDIPVVTNNRKHFVGVDGLAVISEDNP